MPTNSSKVEKQAILSLRQAILQARNKTSVPSLTPFQTRVYTALCQVPPGKVTTYKHLARRIRCRSFQAIGQALRRNPYAPKVPCHRVVAANGRIGGFAGQRDGVKIQEKILLLREEGVIFDEKGNVLDQCIFEFEM